MSTQPERRYTDEEYLALERASDAKSEYLDGVIYAMGGASPRHVQISGNVSGELRGRLREARKVACGCEWRARRWRARATRSLALPVLTVLRNPLISQDGQYRERQRPGRPCAPAPGPPWSQAVLASARRSGVASSTDLGGRLSERGLYAHPNAVVSFGETERL